MDIQYNKLLKAIDAIPSIAEERKSMVGFAEYLTQNDAEITKFGKVTSEVCDYLNKYDFVKGCKFDDMQKKLVRLNSLREKLVKMGEVAKKMMTYPDRYDSKRVVEICRGLALSCMEKMSLSETLKVECLVETNTKKMIDIQTLFMRDAGILLQIKEIVESNKLILNKCKAFQLELKQYVSEFPHKDANDLLVVNNRIDQLQQIVYLWDKADKIIEVVRAYACRYGKDTLLDKYSCIVEGLSLKMCCADIENYKSQLNAFLQELRSLCGKFEDEYKELQSLQKKLQQKSPVIWREFNENMLARISAILNSDSKKVPFDIGRLKMEIVKAEQERTEDINNTLKKYKWLGTYPLTSPHWNVLLVSDVLLSKRYKQSHDELMFKYITSTEYQTSVEKIRKERRKRLLCIPIIGWIILIRSK